MYRNLTRLTVLSLLLLTMGAFAARAVPLAAVEGTWRLDIEATILNTPDEVFKQALRDEVNGPFGEMTLSIDAKGKTMTLAMPGEQPEVIGFAVEKEEGAILVLATEDSSSLHLELKGSNSLAVGVVSDDGNSVEDILYFKR